MTARPPGSSAAHAKLVNDVRLALSAAGHMAFHGNVGSGWVGDLVSITPARCILAFPRKFDTGLPVGFSDVFGFTNDLRPFFFECKTGDARPTKEQRAFRDAMAARGAIATIVRSVDDALAATQRAGHDAKIAPLDEKATRRRSA